MSVSKIVAAAASSAGGAGLDVDEVFSTFLYEGTGASRSITNGIDLSGEGGLVWTKCRNNAHDHHLFDTERGVLKRLRSNSSEAEHSEANSLTAFNSNGYTLGSEYAHNGSTQNFVSWTWRKAPKFFDCISIDVADPEPTSVTVNHNLGQQVGMVIMKSYLHTYPWYVWHRSLNANKNLELNTTAAEASFGGTGFSSTSTTITIPGSFVHSGSSNGKCILYLFAHNDGDGEFGPDSDQDVIKCGSYTGTGSSGNSITLGFEPQFLMVKRTDSSNAWEVVDIMRGFPRADGESTYLRWNASSAEATASNMQVVPSATGFTINSTNDINASGSTWIYMAIRRGPLAAPTDATKVFSMDTQGSSEPYFDSNHIVDMALVKALTTTGDWYNYARFMGEKYLATNTTAAEANASEAGFDFMDGHIDANWGSGFPRSSMWKRAPSYFDVVAYTGTGSGNLQISHNLGVAPEMMWVKIRSGATNDWVVYHKDLPTSGNTKKSLFLNSTSAGGYGDYFANASSVHVAPTSSVFTLGSEAAVNGSSSYNYIAYLFATVAGVSKVGSFTISGSDIDVDCGFSNGARFVIIKRTDSTGNWFQFDTIRGFGNDNDSTLFLNTTDSEQSADYIDPLSSGFSIESSSWANGNYIFYAIA